MGAVGDGGVKKVDLAVAGGLSAGPVKDKAGVVQLIPIGLGKAAAHNPDLIGLCGLGEGSPDRAACRF